MTSSVVVGSIVFLLGGAMGYAASMVVDNPPRRAMYGGVAALLGVVGILMIVMGSIRLSKHGAYGNSLCSAFATTPYQWPKMVPTGDFDTVILSDAYKEATPALKAAVVSKHELARMNRIKINTVVASAPTWTGVSPDIDWWIQPDGNFKITGKGVRMHRGAKGPLKNMTITTQFFEAVPEATEWIYQLLLTGCYKDGLAQQVRSSSKSKNLHSPATDTPAGLFIQYVGAIDLACSLCVQKGLDPTGRPSMKPDIMETLPYWISDISYSLGFWRRNPTCNDPPVGYSPNRKAETGYDSELNVAVGYNRAGRLSQMIASILVPGDNKIYMDTMKNRVGKDWSKYQGLLQTRAFDTSISGLTFPKGVAEWPPVTFPVQKVNGQPIVVTE